MQLNAAWGLARRFSGRRWPPSGRSKRSSLDHITGLGRLLPQQAATVMTMRIAPRRHPRARGSNRARALRRGMRGEDLSHGYFTLQCRELRQDDVILVCLIVALLPIPRRGALAALGTSVSGSWSGHSRASAGDRCAILCIRIRPWERSNISPSQQPGW